MKTLQGVTFYIAGKAIPVTVERIEKEIYLHFPYFKPLIDEIKISSDQRRYVPTRKCWVLMDTRRNIWLINYLMGNKPYRQYDPNKNIENSLPKKELDKITHRLNNLVPPMYKKQPDMFFHCLTKKRCILAGEMRTGKTRPVLELIKYLGISDCWWVAPTSALRGLKSELYKWDFTEKIYLLSYTKFRMITSSIDTSNINNKDINGITLIPRLIVFDEGQKLKNPKSKQGELARDIADYQYRIYGEDSYLLILSGTPAPKDPTDWWNIAEIACPGYLKEGHHLLFKRRLANLEEKEGQIGQKYWHLVSWKKDEIEKLHKTLNGLVKVFLKKDCLDLPPKIYTQIKMETSQEVLRAANMIRRAETKAIVIMNKLRQLSDGFQYVYTPDRVTAKEIQSTHYFKDCPKDEQLKLHLEEYEDIGRIIIYCGFTATINKISNICLENNWVVLKVDGRGWNGLGTALPTDQLLKQMDKSQMENDSSKFGYVEKLAFVAQASSGSTGLELSASPVIIYYSNDDNGDARMQSEDRPHSNNMDKERGLEIIDYYHLPIDELVVKRHKTKQSLQAITLGDIDKIMDFNLEDK